MICRFGNASREISASEAAQSTMQQMRVALWDG